MKIKDTTPKVSREYTAVFSQEELELLWLALNELKTADDETGEEWHAITALKQGVCGYLRPQEERHFESAWVGNKKIVRVK